MATEQNQYKIAYYITPHGFGHAVRSLEVVRELAAFEPKTATQRRFNITIVSDIPQSLVEDNLGNSLPMRRRRLDIGLVQKDSIRFDLEKTLMKLRQLRRSENLIVTEEAGFLRRHHIDLAVCDIPYIPMKAAEAVGIPVVGVSNFTWDWIYQEYARSDPRWEPIIEWIRSLYRTCSLFLQLPLHGDCSCCRRIKPVPLIARRSEVDPLETRRRLQLPDDVRLILISFADLQLTIEARKRLEAIPDVRFLYKRPLKYALTNGVSLDSRNDVHYWDVVAAVDAVVTKPGYGIVSDCLAAGTPVIYCDRGPFPEYSVLVEAIRRYLICRYLPATDLYAGRWRQAIDDVCGIPRKRPNMRLDGARSCAEVIIDLLERERP